MIIQKPVYLMAGGRSSRKSSLDAVLEEIYSLPGKDHPRVAHIGVANGDDHSFFRWMADMLNGPGNISLVEVKLASGKADVQKAKSMLKESDAIFFSGGDVEEGMEWIHHYDLVSFFHELSHDGKVFFGASAGSIMLGTQWVRWPDPDNDNSAELFPCLGIAPVLCDTHAEKDGWDELQVAVKLLGEDKKGYGIPTGSTLKVLPDGTLTDLGKPAVCYHNLNGKVVTIHQ